MGIGKTVTNLLKLSGENSKKAFMEVLKHHSVDAEYVHNFQYFPETINMSLNSRNDETGLPGVGEILQYTGHSNRSFSFTAQYSDNVKEKLDKDFSVSSMVSNGVKNAFPKNPNEDNSITQAMKNNPYARPLGAIKAQLQGLVFPDIVSGVLTDPPLVKLMLEDSDLVGTNGRPNGGIICRIMDISFELEKFWPNGKLMHMIVTFTMKEQFNTGAEKWRFLTRQDFERSAREIGEDWKKNLEPENLTLTDIKNKLPF